METCGGHGIAIPALTTSVLYLVAASLLHDRLPKGLRRELRLSSY